LRIGFEFPIYNVDEPDQEFVYSEVRLVKNIVSEQIYVIAIRDNEITATGGVDQIIPPGSSVDIRDYISFPISESLQMNPDQQSRPVEVTLFGDLSPEGNEQFQLTASPAGDIGPQFSVPIASDPFTASTIVTIVDDDCK